MEELINVVYYNIKKQIPIMNNFIDFKNKCAEEFNINNDELNNYKFIIKLYNLTIELEQDSTYKDYLFNDNIKDIYIQYNFQNDMKKITDLMNNIKTKLNDVEKETESYEKMCENSKNEFEEFKKDFESKIIILNLNKCKVKKLINANNNKINQEDSKNINENENGNDN